MIDTVKLYCYVSDEIKGIIESRGNLRGSYDLEKGQVNYEIVTNSIEKSYSTKLNLRCNTYDIHGNILSVEGSLHKIFWGQNAYNGIYDLSFICQCLIDIIENEYNIELPPKENWYVYRVDIARVFDLQEQKNINDYLYRLSFLNYPRRQVQFYENESIYIPGNTTTLKIYNKLAEFKKHDFNKLCKTDFMVENFQEKIKGYIRYEIEIRKRFLIGLLKKKDIKVIELSYEFLENIWKEEFMKVYDYCKENVISDKIKIKERLILNYGNTKGNRLYGFYMALVTDGEKQTEKNYTKKNKLGKKEVLSTYYRNKRDLKESGIDFSQRYEIKKIDEQTYIDFNPFILTEFKEVS